MLNIYDLNQQVMLGKPDFFSLLEGYETFKGVSFVGDFKIIEQKLLPRFKQVDLVLGLEDQKTSQVLNQYFNISQKAKELARVNEDFLKRLAD